MIKQGYPEVALVTPVANEPELKATHTALKEILKPHTWIWVLVFDQKDPQGYQEALSLDQCAVLWRRGKPNLTQAYRRGHHSALDLECPKIIEFDIGHPLTEIPKTIRLLDDYPLVLGSRFLGNHGGNGSRRFFSSTGNKIGQEVLHLPFSDCSGGFIGFQRNTLHKLNYTSFITNGYAFHLELKCALRHERFIEIPISSNHDNSGFRVLPTLGDLFQLLRSPHA